MGGAPRLAEEMVKRFEGDRLTVYPDQAGLPTIGYGHRCEWGQSAISQAQAEQLLEQDLQIASSAATRISPVLQRAGDKRLSAIVDFIFNLGAGRYQTSTLRRRVNVGDWAAAATETRKWVFAGGRKLPGLVARREVEAQLLEASA